MCASHQKHPLRSLVGLLAGALFLCLVSTVAQGKLGQVSQHRPDPPLTPSDTDSVNLYIDDSILSFIRIHGEDSLRQLVASMEDSLLLARVDSISLLLNIRARRYMSTLRTPSYTASVFTRRRHAFGAQNTNAWRHNITLDKLELRYVSREQVASHDVRVPTILTQDQYRQQKLENSMDRNWRELISRRRERRDYERRGGLGYSITIPGGRESGFTTIFGKNEVNLRVTGNADISPGFVYEKSEQQAILGQTSRTDPSFKMDLRLGVTGTIGDKMEVEVNWDTNRQFDYQNQLKLQYTGYEDEIIQSIEAGNVFLQTQSSLIRGGQSLFGIKSELQLGGFRLTTVASQQEGQSSSLALEGGTETTKFDKSPTDYNERSHYFLSYYFRNRWEEALSDPPNIILDPVFSGITDIEVWKLTPVSPNEQDIRQVVAVVDLGEDQTIVTEADAYTTPERPNPNLDQYTEMELEEELRRGDAVPSDYLEGENMDRALQGYDYQVGQFKKLRSGRDYTLDPLLGYLTLKQSMQESEALAVSFRYLAGGEEVQVGDFASQTGGGDNSQTGDRLVLKLLKPVNLQQPANLGMPSQLNPAAWYLEMRNIYRLGRSLMPSEFELNIVHEPPGRAATRTLAGITGQATLIQVLGLDRLNEDGAPQPDDLFDYLANYTVEPGEGFLIFPYLQPFGRRMDDLITASGLPDEEKELARQEYVFSDLYVEKKINAARNTRLNVYRIEGSYQGGIPSFYDLGATGGVVQNSVRVSSGGVPLTEGVDFIVDYQGSGSVTITNPAYLTSGRNISIEHEENALFNFQTKTLLGARLDYSTSDRFVVGSTVMRMRQKSITDKYRIGEEPISNLIWGVDGSLNLEPRWLTRAIDAVPLLQTKEASTITLQGEFAQLIPGRSVTNAFQDERRDLRSQGRDFNGDELGGISYVDDFEGFEHTITLMRPGAWLLSSAPIHGRLAEDEMGVSEPLTNSFRGGMGWYTLNDHALSELGSPSDPAVSLVAPQAVFPNREVSSQERILTTLDLYFSPHERGPYNYNTDFGSYLDHPRDAWGGMTQRLSEGNTDFTSKNIEFVEFVFRPFPGDTDADEDAMLIIDLGRISEEVIPDNKLNTEDGLSTTEGGPVGALARLSTGQQNQVINPIDAADRITEDLGLDGLASFPDNKFEREGGLGTEQQHFTDFLNSLETTTSAMFPEHLVSEREKAKRDPSGDDYHYFLDNTFYNNTSFYPGGATIQQRFAHFFAGHELNSFEAQRDLSDSSDPIGNSRTPDSEDFNLNSAPDTENSFFQYEVPLNLAKLNELADPERTDDYVVNEIEARGGGGTGWYLVRIPVQDFTRRVGEIQDFTLIESIRMWTTGHTKPITLRFATMELVGSQWRISEIVNQVTIDEMPISEEDPNRGTISIESVNNEENPGYEIPNGTVRTRIREAQSGTVRDAREQAMVLNVEELIPGRQKAVFHTYPAGINFLRYSNLRMFLHLNGIMDGLTLEEQDRGEVRFFMRLGANEGNDFYEIEMPLTPSPVSMAPDEISQRSDYLWRTYQHNPDPDGPDRIDLNSINLQLSLLNQLKFQRDEYEDQDGMPFPTDSTFWSDIHSRLQPALNEFAAPGTRVAVRGTPSLAGVRTIVLGLRNTSSSGRVIDEANIWVNELRVSGYDEETGTAALFNADVKLADLGRVKSTMRMQSDGFGGLQSTLGNRPRVNERDWTVNTQFNVDAFIPERYGWGLPVSFEIKSSTSTPRFDINRGDIRVNSLKDAIAADSLLSSDEISRRQEEIDLQAQTHSETRSYTARVQKTQSRSRFLRATLDATDLTYSFSDSRSRSPQQVKRNSWRWNSALNYRYSIRPRLLYPFWFLRGVGFLDALGRLSFNYVPSSLNYALTADRSFNESKERQDPVRARALTSPLDVAFPTRQQHKLNHSRRFSIQYRPFGFLSLDLETNTQQSLNEIGVDTTFSVILVDTAGVETLMPDTDLRSLLDTGAIDSAAIGVSAFELTNLSTPGAWQVLQRAITGSGEADVRTESYSSRAGASFQPNFRSASLRWLTIQEFGYTANFAWRNGTVSKNTGARVSTNVTLRGGLSLRPGDLFDSIPFYQRLKQSDSAQRSAAQVRKAQRQQERARQREARRERRLQEREAARNEADDPEEGEEEEDNNDAGIVAVQPAPAPADTSGRGGRSIRLPSFLNPKVFLRRTALAITGIQDIGINYTGTRRVESSNVGSVNEDGTVDQSYSLYDAIFNNKGPSLGYRLGFQKSIDDNTMRIINDRLQVSDLNSINDRLQGRATLRLTPQLQVTLNMTAEQDDQRSLTYRLLPDGTIGADTTQGGSNTASVWAFSSNPYQKLFQRQLNRFVNDCGSDCGTDGTFPDAVASDVLTNSSISRDFAATYLTLSGSPGSGGLPFPLPNWRVNYTGISNWPIIRSFTSSASLRHGFSATYATDFQSNLRGGEEDSFSLGSGPTIVYQLPDIEVDAVRINRRYQPLLGLDLGFGRGIQTSFSWNRTNTYSLSTTNNVVSDSERNELTLTASYSISGLRIPFLSRRLSNRINFSITISREVDSERSFFVRRAVEAAISNPEFENSQILEEPYADILTNTSSFEVFPKIAYQFSDVVSADMFVRYEDFIGDSRRLPFTRIEGGFNIRINFSN